MRDPESVARAGYAAARLEQAWERWRARHGLAGSSDPLASYVGCSLTEPMGRPRVVIGIDATEAEYFADFLDGHDCASMAPEGLRPVTGAAYSPVNGTVPAPRDRAAEQMARRDPANPGALGPASPEPPVLTAPGTSPGPMTGAFHQAPVEAGRPQNTPDLFAAELAGWASGELPGQASEHLASWIAAESAPARATDRRMDRSRSVR